MLAFYNLAVMHASGTGVLRSCNMATDVCCIIFLLDYVLNYNVCSSDGRKCGKNWSSKHMKNLDRSSPLKCYVQIKVK